MKNINLSTWRGIYVAWWGIKILWRLNIQRKLVVCLDMPHWVLLCLRYKVCDKNLQDVNTSEESTAYCLRNITNEECQIRRIDRHRKKLGRLIA